ncbi:MAG: hypothetical protein ACYCX9_11995, partial [Candidatus Dormibacteria bacterium]
NRPYGHYRTLLRQLLPTPCRRGGGTAAAAPPAADRAGRGAGGARSGRESQDQLTLFWPTGRGVEEEAVAATLLRPAGKTGRWFPMIRLGPGH